MLNDNLVNILCLLGSPLFRHLVDLDASLSQLSCLSQHSIHLGPRDFELDPYTGELVLDQLMSAAAEDEEEDVNTVDDRLRQLSHGRTLEVIELYKPENGSLGFGVVGLRSELRGELGIFVQEIQPGGVAAKDGRLVENDQIIAINDQPLSVGISHQQAINILQSATGLVRILVARPSSHESTPYQSVLLATPHPPHPPAAESGDMVLNTEWIQVEVITLVNDGTGLGFGIIGGKSTGVVVKTVLPGVGLLERAWPDATGAG